MEPAQKSRPRWLVFIVMLTGLVLIGFGAFAWMTLPRAIAAPQVAKKTALVYTTSNPTDVVGFEGSEEHFRTRLDLAPIFYGTGGDHLVLVGTKAVAVVNIRTGELLAKKPLKIELLPFKQGVVESVYVDSKNAKCYFCGPENRAITKPASLVVLDLVKFDMHDVPLTDIVAQKVIPIGDDLGFCNSDTVYRFSKPPLRQRDGFQGEAPSGLAFRYLPGSGLYSVDSNLGTVSHQTDSALKPVANSAASLAGKRLDDGKIAFDDSLNLALSASWPKDNQSVLQALDLVKGKVLWEKKLSGQIDQLLIGQSKNLWMLDRSTHQLRTLNLKTREVSDSGKLPDSPERTSLLVWAR